MKAAEITDRLIEALRSGQHRFLRVNYANGDMVGHTGFLEPAIQAVEAVDLQLARLQREIDRLGGVLVVTADHGNADEMIEHGKGGVLLTDRSGRPIPKTSHTLNPVPFCVHDIRRQDEYDVDHTLVAPGLGNVAATCLNLMGYQAPGDELPGLLKFR